MASHQELNTKFLPDLRSSRSLGKLLKDKIYPESEKTKTRNKIVDCLSNIMQHNIPNRYSTPGVFKGGSSGKGTSVRTKADLDLVVYMNNYTTVAQLQGDMGTVLQELRDFIKNNDNFADTITFDENTSHSVQFSIKVDSTDDTTDVDLLPAVAPETGKGSRKRIFRKMSKLSPVDRSFYSVSFAQRQVQFVKRRSNKLKDLIRLVKHWKKLENIALISYCIELLVISQWQDGNLKKKNLKSGFKEVMETISTFSFVMILWPSCYKISKYRELPSAPAVMDPTNPFSNTAEWVRPSDIRTIESKAAEIVRWLS